MIISICGDIEYKKLVLDDMKKFYGDKLIICDYFKISFNTVIENERLKYNLIEKCSNIEDARKLFREHIEEVVYNKINVFFEKHKDKIIVLLTDNILTVDIDKTDFFSKSDLKILVKSEGYFGSDYDKSKFDYIVDSKEKIEIKKLVKLL